MPSHHGMNHVIGPAMPPRRWVYLITILMLVGISSVSAGTVYRCLDMLGVECFTDSPGPFAACAPMDVGAAQQALKIESAANSEKQILGPRPGAESLDETPSGTAIHPDRDVPGLPSGSSTSPASTESSQPEGGVP
jgi:hypothetical protein